MSLSIFEFGDGRFRLFRDEREVGWLEGRTVVFVDFPSATAARRAAEVAYDALSAWLSRQRRTDAPPRRGRALGSQASPDGQILTLGAIAIGRVYTHGEGYGFALTLPPNIGASLVLARVIDEALKRHATLSSLETSTSV